MMIRTQVFLPEKTYQFIKIRALREKKPAAQIVREVLEAGMAKFPRPESEDVWAKLAKLNVKGPRDLSKNIDKYLYEE